MHRRGWVQDFGGGGEGPCKGIWESAGRFPQAPGPTAFTFAFISHEIGHILLMVISPQMR